MGNVMTEFVQLLTGGIADLGAGLGGGVNNFVTDLFLKTAENGDIVGLSTFGGVAAIFGGVSLAVGVTTLIFHWVTGLGK